MTRKQKDILAATYMIAAILFFTICVKLGIENQCRPQAIELIRIEEVAPVQPDAEACAGISRQVQQYIEQPLEPDPVNEGERELLAHLIYAEAGGVESDACIYYVGSVVLNRMKDKDFPDTMWEVIYQTEPTLQYACIDDGNINKPPDERCYEVAEALLKYGSVAPENVVYQAEFEQGSGIWKEVDGVIFSYK